MGRTLREQVGLTSFGGVEVNIFAIVCLQIRPGCNTIILLRLLYFLSLSLYIKTPGEAIVIKLSCPRRFVLMGLERGLLASMTVTNRKLERPGDRLDHNLHISLLI